MYNGIGLPTARGSGTNGYVQRNLAHVNKRRQMRPNIVSQPDPDIEKPMNLDLVAHKRKREIESDCLRLRNELEEEGWRQSKIEREVDYYRERKLKKLATQIEEEKERRERKEEAAKKKMEQKDTKDIKPDVKTEVKSTTYKKEVKIEKNEKSKSPKRS